MVWAAQERHHARARTQTRSICHRRLIASEPALAAQTSNGYRRSIALATVDKLEPSSEQESALTLAELLATAPLREARTEVLAGSGRLNVPIRWVHAGEVLDIGALLRGGEVLLTTGLGIGAKAAGQRRFIDMIVDNGGLGLVLELGTTFRHPPEALVARAAEHDLPLVVLGEPVKFVDVTEVAHRRILSDQLGTLRRVDAAHRELLELTLDGAGPDSMLQWLAQRVNIALSLVRCDGAVLFHATPDPLPIPDPDERHDRTPMAFPVPGPAGDAQLRLTLPSHYGPLGTADRAILTRACDLLALSLLRQRQEETLTSRERGDFLAGIMNRELSEREAQARAAAFGWSRWAFLLPVVVAGRSPEQVRAHQDSWPVIMQRTEQELAGQGVAMLAGLVDHENAVVAILGVPASQAGVRTGDHKDMAPTLRADLAERMAKIVRAETARLLPDGNDVALCVGEPAREWTQAGVRLREVADLAPTSIASHGETWLDFARPDIGLLIKQLVGNETLDRFVERRLEVLERADGARRSELIHTLEVLFEHNGNKASTARALRLERQSMYSRLQRIEELLGESLSDANTRFGLQLALYIRRVRL